jgi:hypothetical protein
MKRITFIAVVLLLLLSSSAFALDYIVGAKGGFYVWEPFIKEMDAPFLEDIDKGEGFLYGPVVSILFTAELSLSAALLTGKQNTHWFSPNQYQPERDAYMSGTYYVNMNRTDIDTALSYRLLQNMKIFLGYKIQIIETNMKYTERRYSPDPFGDRAVYEGDINTKTPSHGPALGIGYSLPLGKGYFVAANLSGLYMWGKFEPSQKRLDYHIDPDSEFQTGDPIKEPGFSLDTRQIGLNFEPSIGFSAGESWPIITLGLRYQLLRTKFIDKVEDLTPSGYVNDQLYGVFMSVLFVF